MNKKTYEEAEMEIVTVEMEDVITASIPGLGENELPWDKQ